MNFSINHIQYLFWRRILYKIKQGDGSSPYMAKEPAPCFSQAKVTLSFFLFLKKRPRIFSVLLSKYDIDSLFFPNFFVFAPVCFESSLQPVTV